jgi:hypothetical protein
MRQSVKWAGLAVLIVLDIADFDLALGHPGIFADLAPVLLVVTVVYGLFAAMTSTTRYQQIAAGDWEPYPYVPPTETRRIGNEPIVALVPHGEPRSAAAELASALRVDGERIWIPEGSRYEAVLLQVFGTRGRYGYQGWAKIKNPSPNPSSDSIYWPNSEWAGLVPNTGLGWFIANAYRFVDDRFKDVLVFTILPPDVKKSLDIRGSWKDGSLESTLLIDGAYLGWTLKPYGSEQVHPHMLWVEGRYGPGRFDLNRIVIASEKGEKDLRIQRQPLRPVVVVAHKKQLTPLSLINGLTEGGFLSRLMVGGRRMGSFKGSVVPGGVGLHRVHFDSEPFTF